MPLHNKFILTLKKFLKEFLFADILAISFMSLTLKRISRVLPPGYSTYILMSSFMLLTLIELIDWNLLAFYEFYSLEIEKSLLTPPNVSEYEYVSEVNIQKLKQIEHEEKILLKDNFKVFIYGGLLVACLGMASGLIWR